MLSFSRKTDYALIGLAHLAGNAGEIASARQVADTYQLSPGLMMKVLKALHHHSVVRSVRGVKGGYQLSADLHELSLHDLIDLLRETDCCDAAAGSATGPESNRLFREATEGHLPTEAPLLAVHYKLMRFLKDVKLSDLIVPGRRIDVPVELVRKMKKPVAVGTDATRVEELTTTNHG